MVKERMGLLGLLCKRGSEVDPGYLDRMKAELSESP